MTDKVYIVQGGFQPVGAADVTGWRNHLICRGRGAKTRAIVECKKETAKSGDYCRRFRVVSATDCSRKDAYTYVAGFESSAKTF